MEGGGGAQRPMASQDFKEICGTRNDKGGMPPPPPRLSASVTYSMLEPA
jgi:hypothetical protein